MSPPFPNSPKPTWYRGFNWKSAGSKRNGVHYVGDDVVLDITDFPAKLTADFENGSNGNPVTTAAGEGSLSPWSSFDVAGGNTITYSNTVAAHGGLSAKVTNPGGAGGPSMSWEFTEPSIDYYGRGYMYRTGYPAATWSFADATLDGVLCWALRLTSAGKIEAVDAPFVTRISFTNAIALNQWVRIEWHMSHPSGAMEVKLFNSPDSTTATETKSFPAAALRAGADKFSFGGTFLGDTLYWDDIVTNALSYPGPYSASDHDENPSGTLTCTVRDYFGTVVSTGEFPEDSSTLELIAPGAGWKPGWYRVYLTGPQTDANFANSYGVTNFCVIKSDAHFVAMPAGDTADQGDKDFVMKGVMGLGTSRMELNDVANPAAEVATIQAWKAVADDYWSDNGIPDSGRPARENWVAFVGATYDELTIPGTTPVNWGAFYPIDSTVDGSQVFVTVSTGTSPNTDKVQIHYPNASTLAETYDNLPSQNSAQTEINGSSTLVRFFAREASRATHPAQAAIGSSRKSGTISAVSSLYASGITRFEGPENEGVVTAEGAHQMKLFQGYVHAGNASAKAIGPCFVSIAPNVFWTSWLDAGGGSYCDEISFHAYNFDTNGDLNLGRVTLAAFKADLAARGLGSKPLWQTESTQPFNSVFGVYHPRRARRTILATLMLEEIGCPRERNIWWYDIEHGFWAFPSFLEHGDGSLGPEVVLGRVLAEETWGKSYDSALDFGTLGNAIYLGSVYTAGDGSSTVVLMATSYMTGASVALTVTGTAGPVTVVDGFGNEKAMPLSKGRITIPMTDVPAYVRLPAGASATPYRVNGWSPLGIGSSVSSTATVKEIDGVSYPVIGDNAYITVYGSGTGIAPPGADLAGPYAETPGTTTLTWPTPTQIERVIVWCGSVWQSSGTLVDFDVQTYDGSSWTTRKTVTKPDPPWFYFGSDGDNAGCFVETYWDEQWVFDVEFDQAVTCRGVRLNVRQASYGGEPLPCPVDPWQHGQGTPTEGYKIQEIAAVDVNRYAGVT